MKIQRFTFSSAAAQKLLVLSLVGVLGSFFLSGCRFGNATFSHDFDGLRFAPDGTVFAYIDAHDEFHAPVEQPRVVLFSTWLVFTPTADLTDLSGAELEDMRHEFALRESLSLVFNDQRDVDDGADFDWTQEGSEIVEGDASAALRLHLPPERLDASSRYSTFNPFASRREIQVQVDEAVFDQGGRLQGSFKVEMSRAEFDLSDARTGSLEMTFGAPLVDELIAEKNLAALHAQDVVGLPLAPVAP
ncbi:MAG: hypothetical protein GY822_25335 [Deltaproteobacteria bacterium]|nr:hypothetical protein [Deltaproteobacteria bacterium]